MKFLNIIKSLFTKNKQYKKQFQEQINNYVDDNLNCRLVDHNNINSFKKHFYFNKLSENNFLQNEYFNKNKTYKQNELNNTKEKLYENNNTVCPSYINLNNKYNCCINNSKYNYFKKDKNLTKQNLPQMSIYSIDPYNNKTQNNPELIQGQILPRRIKQNLINDNTYYEYLFKKQNKEILFNSKFNNKYDCFNDICINNFNNIYKHKIIDSCNKLQSNDLKLFHNFKNSHELENFPYCLNANSLTTNSICPKKSMFYKKNIKNNCFNYESKLLEKKQNNYFNKKNINSLVPLEISREIRSEKIWTLFLIIISFIGIIGSSFYITLYYISYKQKLELIIGLQTKYIPHPFFSIVILIITTGFLFTGIFDLLHIKNEKNNYFSNLFYNKNIIPNFLINSYKKLTVRNIILNWLAFSIYLFGGIILGILYWFQQYSGEKFQLGFWSWGIVNDLTTAITIMIVILITVLGIYTIGIILIKKRKTNIISCYNYEIINPEELAALKKKTNRICFIIFIIFLIILTLIISIPWLIAINRKQNGKLLFNRWFNN